MSDNFIYNLFTFRKKYHNNLKFRIKDLTICKVHDQIPYKYKVLTDNNDNIIIVKKGNVNYFLIYSICTSSTRFYNLIGCDINEHEFELDGKFYKIESYESYTDLCRIYYKDSCINYDVFDESTAESQISNNDQDIYKANVNDSIENLVLLTLNAYKPSVLDKMFCLVIYVKNCAFYLYIVQRREDDMLRCDVIMSKEFFFAFYILIYFDINKTSIRRFFDLSFKYARSVDIKYTREDNHYYLNIGTETEKPILQRPDINSIAFKPPSNFLSNGMTHLQPKTLIYIIRTILNEQKLVLLSTNNDKLNQTIIFIRHCLVPFSYDNASFSVLSNKLDHMLDLPFPFIFGIISTMDEFKSKPIAKDVVVIDLDSTYINKRPKPKLPYESTLLVRMESENWADLLPNFFNMLQNNIDIAREKMIHKYINTDYLCSLIKSPKLIIEGMRDDYLHFYEKFFETKTFRNYIFDNKKASQHYEIFLLDKNYLGLGFKTADMLNISKLWHTLATSHYACETDTIEVGFDSFENSQILLLLPYLFDIFSRISKYEEIRKLYKYMIENEIQLTPQMYKNINISNKKCCMCFYRYVDLSEYTIRANSYTLSKLSCVQNTIFVFKGKELLCEVQILGVESLISAIYMLNQRLTKENMQTEHPQLFWSILFYFTITNLPINLSDKNETPSNGDLCLQLT